LADNLEITSGTGTSIATDEVDGKHFQKMKIANGDADSAVMVSASSEYGLEVDITRIATGTNNIGDVDVASIAAGTNLIGKVSIDQVTANANEVVLKASTASIGKLASNTGVDIGDVDVLSIAAGTNLIGKVSIDQVTANANEVVVKSGTVTAVTAITNALPAGTVLLGKVSIDQVTGNANEVVVKSITAGDTNIGNVDVVTLPSLIAGSAIIGNVRVDQTTPGTTNGVVVNSGTVTTVSTVTSVTAVAGMPTGASATQVQGTIAAGTGVGQNPVQIGGKGITTLPAVVDTGDVVNITTDVLGRIINVPWSPSADRESGLSVALTDTTSTTASGAALKWYITDILVTNSHATVGTLVSIEDTAGSPVTLWQGYAAAAGGGFSYNFSMPIATSAVNLHIHAKCGTTGSNVYVCINAFKAP
jgi:hypothetical protein